VVGLQTPLRRRENYRRGMDAGTHLSLLTSPSRGARVLRGSDAGGAARGQPQLRGTARGEGQCYMRAVQRSYMIGTREAPNQK
jgi:hypothetical protein